MSAFDPKRTSPNGPWERPLVGRSVWSVQFLHRLVDGLLQAQRVSALPRWVVLQAFDLCGKELLRCSGHPYLLGKEFAANVTPLMGLRVHLLHRIHQETAISKSGSISETPSQTSINRTAITKVATGMVF